MASKNSDAAALIRAGRGAFRPTDAERDRVLSALSDRLGDGLLDPSHGPAAGAQAAGRLSRLGWRLWTVVGVASIGLGLGLNAARTHATAAPSIPPTAEPPPVVAVAPPEVAPPEQAAAPEPPPEERAPPPASSGAAHPRAASRADKLSEEVRLLSSAERDMNHGRADEALRALTEHERRFPSGALAEERLAARVQALCLGGRRNEAKAYLAQLAQSYPRSPHLKRARAVCSADARP